MSLTWIKSWISQDQSPVVGVKSEAMIVAESLLMELDLQMQQVEDEKQEAEEMIRKRNNPGVADYSWLVSTPKKYYEMPPLERLELENLCMKIKPEESGRVITSFRESLIRQPDVGDIPKIMRAIVIHILESRAEEDTMPQWVMKSLTKLRPTSARVTPMSEDEATKGDMVTHLDELPV